MCKNASHAIMSRYTSSHLNYAAAVPEAKDSVNEAHPTGSGVIHVIDWGTPHPSHPAEALL